MANPRLLALVSIAVLLPAVLFFAVAWYYASEIKSGALTVDESPNKFDLRILEVKDGTILLGSGPGVDKNGAWAMDGLLGLEFEGGYAHLGGIIERNPASVRRALALVTGNLTAGMAARADSSYFSGDPRSSFGLDFSDVVIPGPLGPLPAWYVPGPRSIWVIFVHGKGSDRREGLRLLPAVNTGGYPFLDVSYRNDAGVYGDGRFGYGRSEWPDLEAAVAYAKGQGARAVVLAGYSMGGSIALAFLEHSSLSSLVSGLVLDAPLIDLAATLDYQGKRRGLPPPLTDFAEWLASRRFKIDWRALDYRDVLERLRMPVLLFHGDADQLVPVATSDLAARRRPDAITYVRVAGAGHVRSWNRQPGAYDAAIASFLQRLANGEGER